MNDAPMRADRSTSRVGRIWLDLEPRRGRLFLINIGVPILIGVARGEGRGALIGGITGLLLSLADIEGPLARRVRLTLMVAAGIAVGGLLGTWLKSFEAIFWIAFFLAVFAAGFLNQVGKGPHFSLRFGAISFAVVAGLPAIETLDYVYWGLAVMISLASRSADHFINGPLHFAGPWFGADSFDRWGWVRFSLAYALAATIGLWIGIESASIRAVWISAITLVLMVPDVRVTYSRVFGGMIGTVLAVGVVWLITSLGQSTVLFCAAIFLAAFLLPSQITRFWIFSGMIAVIVLLAWDLASADPALEPALLWERLADMLVGAMLVLVLTALVFPDVTKSLLVARLRKAE
jgi:Fusaric acid resistance protein-like